jgi:hypothetical protein
MSTHTPNKPNKPTYFGAASSANPTLKQSYAEFTTALNDLTPVPSTVPSTTGITVDVPPSSAASAGGEDNSTLITLTATLKKAKEDLVTFFTLKDTNPSTTIEEMITKVEAKHAEAAEKSQALDTVIEIVKAKLNILGFTVTDESSPIDLINQLMSYCHAAPPVDSAVPDTIPKNNDAIFILAYQGVQNILDGHLTKDSTLQTSGVTVHKPGSVNEALTAIFTKHKDTCIELATLRTGQTVHAGLITFKDNLQAMITSNSSMVKSYVFEKDNLNKADANSLGVTIQDHLNDARIKVTTNESILTSFNTSLKKMIQGPKPITGYAFSYDSPNNQMLVSLGSNVAALLNDLSTGSAEVGARIKVIEEAVKHYDVYLPAPEASQKHTTLVTLKQILEQINLLYTRSKFNDVANFFSHITSREDIIQQLKQYQTYSNKYESDMYNLGIPVLSEITLPPIGIPVLSEITPPPTIPTLQQSVISLAPPVEPSVNTSVVATSMDPRKLSPNDPAFLSETNYEENMHNMFPPGVYMSKIFIDGNEYFAEPDKNTGATARWYNAKSGVAVSDKVQKLIMDEGVLRHGRLTVERGTLKNSDRFLLTFAQYVYAASGMFEQPFVDADAAYVNRMQAMFSDEPKELGDAFTKILKGRQRALLAEALKKRSMLENDTFVGGFYHIDVDVIGDDDSAISGRIETALRLLWVVLTSTAGKMSLSGSSVDEVGVMLTSMTRAIMQNLTGLGQKASAYQTFDTLQLKLDEMVGLAIKDYGVVDGQYTEQPHEVQEIVGNECEPLFKLKTFTAKDNVEPLERMAVYNAVTSFLMTERPKLETTNSTQTAYASVADIVLQFHKVRRHVIAKIVAKKNGMLEESATLPTHNLKFSSGLEHCADCEQQPHSFHYTNPNSQIEKLSEEVKNLSKMFNNAQAKQLEKPASSKKPAKPASKTLERLGLLFDKI